MCATFFVTGREAARHPGIVRDILSRGHSIGNHSFSHMPLLMLKGMRTLRREVKAAQTVLGRFGIVPLAFRPPVGITNPHLWRVLLEQGMYCVNFSCRAADMGNLRVAGLVVAGAEKGFPGRHRRSPRRRSAAGQRGAASRRIRRLIRGLKEKGLEIVPLARLIGKEVMQRGVTPGDRRPATLFYDALAADYDHEQFNSAVSISRRTEYALFEAQVPRLFDGADRVLEIGAGTGIFTLAIARRCREVVAVDISGGMLEVLKRKPPRNGWSTSGPWWETRRPWIWRGRYSLACAFSSLEYLADLPAFFKRLARHLEPGGTLYFITARRSLLGVFHPDRQRRAAGSVAQGAQPPRNRRHARGRRLRGDPGLLPPAQVLGSPAACCWRWRPAGAAGSSRETAALRTDLQAGIMKNHLSPGGREA